jgi:hypothetical protein
MVNRVTVCIRKLSNGRTEAARFERWLRNKNVSKSALIREEQLRTAEMAKGRHVLGVQDTTELNYQRHANRVSGLGTVGNGKDLGFFLHPMVVLDAGSGACLGNAAIHIENRLEGASDTYQRLSIEEKESYRWISTAQTSKKVLSEAKRITFIGDRENDIYEFIDRIPDEKTDVITRIRSDRILMSGEKLYSHIDKVTEAGRIAITIPAEKRKRREKREAILSIKYSVVEIKRPKNCSDKKASESIKLRVVEAKELNCPIGQEPIHWRLLTTHRIEDYEQALQIVSWYQKRWNIEQVFRTMKKQGLDIESSQVETAESLMKLAIIGLCAAIKIIQLVLAREGETEQKTEDVFTQDERIVLALALTTLEGKTLKQKNPYPQENLAWATWIIARLGGWQGYIRSEGPPGPITIRNGLERFQGIYDGYKLSKIL